MSESLPLVSVVLPVFNAEDSIGRAIRSVLDQSEANIELIVVDDGSSDGTRAAVERALISDERGRLVVCEENRGVVTAANLGHRLAKAELVARMDADDWCYPNRLRKQVDLLAANPGCDVCATGIRVTALEGESVGDGFRRFELWVNRLLDHEQMMAQRFIETPIVQPSAMIRRSTFERLGGYRDCRWAEDYDLWLRMAEAGCRFAKLDEILLDWRDSPGRLTRSDPRYGQKIFLEAKAHFLAKIDRAAEHGVAIGGAGSNGKLLAQFFLREGIRVHRFYEVHPRRVGKRIGGIEVFSSENLRPADVDSPLLVGAVGVEGGRDRVLAWALESGYREGDSFFSAV